MQIIHPYRHNAVTVCIFMPFDWRTAIASLLSYSAILKTLTRTSPELSNGCLILGLLEIENIWGRCSPISVRVPACPTAPIMLHVPETRLGHQCRWGELNLHLETLWLYWERKDFAKQPTELEAASDQKLYASPFNTSKSILHQPGNIYKLLSDKSITRKAFLSHITAK